MRIRIGLITLMRIRIRIGIRLTFRRAKVTADRIEILSSVCLCAALPRAPSQVRVTEVQSTSVRLSWSYDGDAASEVQYYVIQYKPKVWTNRQFIQFHCESELVVDFAAKKLRFAKCTKMFNYLL
jgi:hypothetical protein